MSFFKELKRRNVFRVGIAYTVAAWLLIQVTDIVFPRIGLPDSAVTLVIALLAIGFIPALIFAWAFEMTPEGIKREKDVDRSQSITPQTGRKLDRVIILILAVVVAWFLFDEYYLEPQQTEVSEIAVKSGAEEAPADNSAATSIAVLPFVNMSADAENEYFSDGISEELLNVLVKISTLHVASRTSAFAYKGKDLPLSQIAAELKVDNVLEGSVRKSGNRVRITAQLINAKSDRHIWSETYERELVDIFDIQEEISNNIVAALKVALNVDESAAMGRAQRPTENPEAYELYLQGRFSWRQRHEQNIRHSIDLFEQAIALDPGFARAYEALAVAWAVMPAWSDVSNKESVSKSKPPAERALQLDPTLSEARAVLAEVALDEHRWADAVAQYREVTRNEPRNPTPHQWLAESLAQMGFISEALKGILKAYELDPASPVINQSVSWIAALNREDDLAYKHVEISKGLGVGNRAIFAAYDALARRGDWDMIDTALNSRDHQTDVSLACHRAERDPSPENLQGLSTILTQYIAKTAAEMNSNEISYCLAFIGQQDLAAEIALKDIEEKWYVVRDFWASNPQAGSMRQTGAFRQALADLGLLDFYRTHGWPDLCRPVGEDDFECNK